MRFDLLVFDPKSAPRLRSAFLSWYRTGTGLGPEYDYNSPHALHPPLRAFYDQMRQQFVPLNGPDALARPVPVPPVGGLWRRLTGTAAPPPAPSEPERRAHYSFAPAYILLSFERNQAERAYAAVLRTAHDCGVGFFDASNEWGEILHDAAQFHPHLQALRSPL